MILNESESKRLLEKIIGYSKADAITAVISGANTYNIRFALNSASTNGFADGLNLSVTSDFGKRSGTVSINKFDDDSIKAAVEKSEQAARLSPEGKEHMPPLEPQVYAGSANYSENTEEHSVDSRASIVQNVIEQSASGGVNAAGYLEDETSFTALMNSKGLFAYNKGSLSSFSSTIRTNSGNGSSRVEKSCIDSGELGTESLTKHAVERSLLSVNPAEIKPGRYTVILEPSAAADMIALCLNFMGSRQADEGRSFFSKKGGGNLIGEKLVKDSVNIYSDPLDKNAPSFPFSREGYPREKVDWFSGGVLKNLHRSRYWAQKTSSKVIPYPSNVIMKGNNKTLDELISGCDYAILVTRFWYIRTVDPSTMLLTGLTRDGVFEVINGKIARPVKNFRFNESPMNVLANVIDFTHGEKATGSETDDMQIHVPALKVANFNFSSLSDAI